MFLGEEGMPSGANWILEIAARYDLAFKVFRLCTVELVQLCWHNKALKGVDYAWEVARRRAQVFPSESFPKRRFTDIEHDRHHA